ncbi:hypothetical protein LTR28_010182 [Elasticomyces elasticus]|nr:hypothetical protein LTR28_010182 [Elasticomyces elasticus]
MPAYLVPKRSGAHRIAGIALFRALLVQCTAIPLLTERQHALQNFVRHRFKANVELQSTRLLKDAFTAGYELGNNTDVEEQAIDHLDASAAGNVESTTYISSLLDRVSKHLTRTPKRPKPTAPSPSSTPPTTPKLSVFDRPLPLDQLSGLRHVPKLVNAQKLPMLRLKKPQPHILSQIISHHAHQRERRHELMQSLQSQLSLADAEDAWDVIVERETGVGAGSSVAHRKGVEEPDWKEAFVLGVRELGDLLSAEREGNRKMAERMVEVVEREREMFERGKAERMGRRREERIERRRVRREEGCNDVVEHAGDEPFHGKG